MTDIYGLTNKGGRSYNQDSITYEQSGIYSIAVVADGLGAYDGSEIASDIATGTILNWFRHSLKKGEDVLSPATLTKAVKSAHNAIKKIKGIDGVILEGCTTIAVAVTDTKRSIAATLGDTRIYLFKNGRLYFQSKDHSLAQLAADRGDIQTKEIRIHPDQNKLTKVLGSDGFYPPDIRIFSEPLHKGDAFLLCSDGFWEYVYEWEMEDEINRSDSAKHIITTLEKKIPERASEYNDNYSAVMIKITN